jgi:hypothetical protein
VVIAASIPTNAAAAILMFNGDFFHVPVYALPGDRAVQSGDWPAHERSLNVQQFPMLESVLP